jgi:2-keto-4-pentenoate hydratase/2-oxohepta-3-ene-1,7-dioic acid hydratase in catechol pathway
MDCHDAMGDVTALTVKLWVTDERRQIFEIPALIRTIGRSIMLQPDEIIATGRPVGVGMASCCRAN